MADTDLDQEELALDAEQDAEEEAAPAGDADASAEEEATGESDEGAEGEGDDAELVVSIGGEEAEPEEEASPVIRDIRKAQKEAVRGLRAKERENEELKAELARLKGGTAANEPLGAKPTLAGCDYDEDKFASELETWHSRKAQAEQEQAARKREQEQAAERWNTRLASVDTACKALKVRDLDDAMESFRDAFSVVQQGIVIDLTEDPKDAALLRYALGKNPAIAKKLAAEQNPVRFAGAVAKILYKDLNVKPRKTAPPPERVVRSTVAGSAAVDKALTRLQEEANRTGDRSKVAAYLRNKQRAEQAA